MTALAEKASKKLFEKHIQQYAPADPLYENYTDHKGRQKRRKRLVPPGLSKRDEQILKSVNKRAHYLDKGLDLCGFRVGWTFFIGAVPGAGDVVNIWLNYTLVVKKARQADIPDWLLTRMLVNNAIAGGVGLVPIVGDVCMAVFKTNSRNAALLEEYLRLRGEELLKAESGPQNQVKKISGSEKRPSEILAESSTSGSTRKKSFFQRNPKKDVQHTQGKVQESDAKAETGSSRIQA